MNRLNQIAKYMYLPSLLLASTIPAYALEVKVGQSYSDLPLDQSGTVTNVKPSGTHISVAHDLSDQFRIHVDYIDWDARHISNRVKSINIDSSSYAATLSYFIDNFAISANYTYWQSEYTESYQRRSMLEQKTDAPSYGLAVGYGIFFDEWVIEPSMTLQYNKWRYREPKNNYDSVDFAFTDQLEDETFVVSALLSASKVIELAPDTYLLSGAVVRWNEIFQGSGEQKPEHIVSFAGQRSMNQISDDDYAELSFFVTYDITPQWLIELDTSIAFLPADNYSSLSWRVGYRF